MVLLAIGAVLVVLGMFDSFLNWDIFGRKVEAILTAIFASSVALAVFGVAMTIVLGTQDIVVSFRRLQEQKNGGKTESEASGFQYYKIMVVAVIIIAVLIVILAGANWKITAHRSRVFKEIVNEQMVKFGPKIADKLDLLSVPKDTDALQEVDDLLKTLKLLSFINCVELYIPDKSEASMLWSYSPAWGNEIADFKHIFVARKKETAIYEAMNGNNSKLETYNKDNPFKWLHIVRGKSGPPVGVLGICANESENFREYKLGS
jgi:phosphatidylglycerophosphate synthase